MCLCYDEGSLTQALEKGIDGGDEPMDQREYIEDQFHTHYGTDRVQDGQDEKDTLAGRKIKHDVNHQATNIPSDSKGDSFPNHPMHQSQGQSSSLLPNTNEGCRRMNKLTTRQEIMSEVELQNEIDGEPMSTPVCLITMTH